MLTHDAKLSFGPFDFPSMKAANTAISAILNKYDLLQPVTAQDDEALLREVLKKHPGVEEKTKGLAIIRFEVHPYIGGGRTFYFYRSDGSRDNFSIKECIKNAARS